MRTIFLLATTLLFYSTSAFTQNEVKLTIIGQVYDSVSRQPLTGVQVMLLGGNTQSSDIATTNKLGFFSIKASKSIAGILLFKDNYRNTRLKATYTQKDTIWNIGNVYMSKLIINLDEVQVSGQVIKAKVTRDTTEFNAARFQTQDNAMLKDLLTKIPGLTVMPDGTLKYNDEAISRITIEGQEYFGGNTSLALKNLNADLIDKIQIVRRDKDGSQQGDDLTKGTQEKVLNLTIKADKKNKIIGQVSIGIGNDSKYTSGFTFNRFGNSDQMSLIGSRNNINNINENRSSSNGITTTTDIGFNFSTKKIRKSRLTASAYFQQTQTENSSIIDRQYINSTSPTSMNQQTSSNQSNTNFKADVKFEKELDTLNFLIQKISFNYGLTKNKSNSSFLTLFSDTNTTLNGISENHSNNKNQSWSYNATYRHLLKEKKGFFSTDLTLGYAPEKNNTYFQSLYTQQDSDSIKTLSSNNNWNPNPVQNKMISLYTALEYNISKSVLFIGASGTTLQNTQSDNNLYSILKDINGNNTYLPIDTLSYRWSGDNLNNAMAVGFVIKQNKWDIRSFANWSMISQKIRLNDTSVVRNNKSIFFPQLDITYNFNPGTRLIFSTNSYMTPVFPIQLISVPNIQNPLQVISGNPNLQNSVNNRYSLSFSHFNPKSLFVISGGLEYAVSKDKIINSVQYDSLGRQIAIPINMNGTNNFMGRFNVTEYFFKKKFKVNLNGNSGVSTTPFIINATSSINKTYNTAGNIGLNYTKGKLLEINAGFGANYMESSYELDSTIRTYNTMYNFSLDYQLNLPLKFSIGMRYSRIIYAGLGAGFNQPIDLWNSFISKQIMKGKAAIKLQGFDLLNKNTSISRTIGVNYIEDARNLTMQRFFLLSFSYYFK
ncbi:outer membrane beta-barrel protein [Chitinophaga dinghuensis]|uniref:Outer membrane beta-barrel protein n=1 Tax=Chitinophaga dinghuensis TaxID=1539050 RepID=A0A327VZR0_9BACT|nr:outer membrane beta-barrel protein [Chitinophaga dinghuensis]RAJ81972.1 outer membrane beta-barrel protein [Chitinophaga dinghuensis]